MIEEILSYMILGLIQGLTEFLPVSSSGHLTLCSEFLGIKSDDITFKVLVHFATALSTIIVFRKDIINLSVGFFKKNTSSNASKKYIGLLSLSAIPAAVVGFALKGQIEALDNTKFVGYMLILTALILGASQRLTTFLKKSINSRHAILIGAAQAIAILPGISRSGSTIGAALLLGVSREEAARFSFLMALPVIIGATLLEAKDLLGEGATSSGPILGYIVGVLVAFSSGLIACKLMVRLVKSANLLWFSVYCAIIGLLSIIF